MWSAAVLGSPLQTDRNAENNILPLQALEKELAGSIQKGVDFVAGGGKK
jgi:hypothetical protein